MHTLQTVISFIGIFPEVIILFICITYLSKTRTTDSVLLFAGSLIQVLLRLFYAIVPVLGVVNLSGSDDVIEFYAIGNFIALIGSIAFCAGMVMLIRRVLVTIRESRH